MFFTRIHPDLKYNELTEWFIKEYEKVYNEPITKIEYKVMSIFDSILVIADAIERAQSLEGGKIIEALKTTKLKVAGGVVEFGGDEYIGTVLYHQNINPTMLICQFDKNRKPVIIKKVP